MVLRHHLFQVRDIIFSLVRVRLHEEKSCVYEEGMEAVGVVTAVGYGVTGTKVGDRVGYAGRPMGSYSEERLIFADRLVPIPENVDDETAAAILLKGMTAQFLLRRCFNVDLTT